MKSEYFGIKLKAVCVQSAGDHIWNCWTSMPMTAACWEIGSSARRLSASLSVGCSPSSSLLKGRQQRLGVSWFLLLLFASFVFMMLLLTTAIFLASLLQDGKTFCYWLVRLPSKTPVYIRFHPPTNQCMKISICQHCTNCKRKIYIRRFYIGNGRGSCTSALGTCE